jgi:putative transposase
VIFPLPLSRPLAHNGLMPRTARASQGGYCYQVLNRGNGRRTVFHKDGDYAAFLKLLTQAAERTPVRLLA